MEKFIKIIVLMIVGSFVLLVSVHTFTLVFDKEYCKTLAQQETIFIAILTLALMIVLIIPYTISKEQIKREVENHWKNEQKNIQQFISKAEINYAHTSRMMAYLLKQEEHYYWAMAWAGDSVVAYIRRFKEHRDDFEINEEYFKFSLWIMKISFRNRYKGIFLEKNIYDLEIVDNTKEKIFFKKFNWWAEEKKPSKFSNDFTKEINNKIYKGKVITQDEKIFNAIKELKRVILRYIKWQCIIYIEMQGELFKEVKNLIKEHLNFEENFKDMVNNTLNSFYCNEKNGKVDRKQFINDIVKKVNDIVEKVELEKEREKVRTYLEEILKSTET